jgi:hypothetical protein
LPYAIEKTVGTATPEDDKYYQAWLDYENQKAQQAAPQGPATPADLFGGKVGIGRFLEENIAYGVPMIAGTIAGGLAGGAVGGPVGGFVGSTGATAAMFGGMNVQRAVQDNGTLSQAAAERSLMVSPLQAIPEVALGHFIPGLGRALGVGAAEETGNVLARVAKSAIKGAAVGATAMAVQEAGQRYAAGEPLDGREAASDLVSAFATGGILGGTLSAFGGLRRGKLKTADPNTISNDDLNKITAEPLQVQPAGLLTGPGDTGHGTMFTDASGRTFEGVGGKATQSQTAFAFDANTPEGQTVYPYTVEPGAIAMSSRSDHGPAPEIPGSPLLEQSPTLFGREGGPASTKLQDVAPDVRQFLQKQPTGDLLTAADKLAQVESPTPSHQLMLGAIQEELQSRETANRPQLAPPAEGEPVAFSNTAGETAATSPEARVAALLRDQPSGDLKVALERAQSTDNKPMVEALQRELNRRDVEEPNFETKLERAKKGLRGGFVQKVEAANEEDLLHKVYNQIFVEQDTRKNTQKFAQRLGILDENLQPTDLARQIETRQAQAAEERGVSVTDTKPTVAETFANLPADARKMQLGLMKDEDRAQLETQLMQDLGRSPVQDEAQRAAAGATPKEPIERKQVARDTKLERAGIEMGLLDEKTKELTPKGQQAALRIPVPTEDVINAAREQGFEGARAAMFERGATGTPVDRFDSLSDAAAYLAGRRWKVPETADTETTRNILYGENQEARKLKRKELEVGRERSATVLPKTEAEKVERGRVESLTPEQEREQRFHEAIDQLNLPAGKDIERKTLHDMVRSGATNAELDAAAKKVQQGGTLFVQPEQSKNTYKGEKVSRGQPRTSQFARAADVEEQLTKAGQRAETARLTREFLVREQLRAAHDSGDIDRVTFMKAVQALEHGDVNAALGALPGWETQLHSDMGRDIGDIFTNAKSASEIETAVQGKKAEDVVKYLTDIAPNEQQRTLMQSVARVMAQLKATGVKIEFRVLQDGSSGGFGNWGPNTRGLTRWSPKLQRYQVLVAGKDFGPVVGTDYQTIAHEFTHVATMAAYADMERRGFPDTDAGNAARELKELHDALIAHVQNLKRAGELSPIEKYLFDNGTNILADPQELIAWGNTNGVFQRYLDSIDVSPEKTFWGKFVDIIRRLLRLPDRSVGALEVVLKHTQTLMDIGEGGHVEAQRELAKPLTVARVDGIARESVDWVVKAADKILERGVTPRNASKFLGWMSLHHISEQYGKLLPSARDVEAAHFEREAVQTRFAQLVIPLEARRTEMIGKFPVLGKSLDQLMAATEFQIDPTRTWDKQTHLHNLPNAKELEELTRKSNQWYGNLVRAGYGDLYDNMRRINEANNFASLSMLLHNLVSVSPELSRGIAGSDVNPVDAFRENEALHGNPEAAHAYWQRTLNDRVAETNKYINQLRGEAMGDRKQMAAVDNMLSPVEQMMVAVREHMAAMQRAPYFHLGRFGDHFVSFEIKKKGNLVDKDALNKVADALEAAGHSDISISRESTQSNVYIRTPSATSREAIKKLALELKKQGLLEPDTKILGGLRASSANVERGANADSLNKLVRAIEASPIFQVTDDMTKEEKADINYRLEQTKATMREIWLDSLPDTSMAKVMTRRNAVLGYSRDMFRAYAFRAQISAKSLANLAATPKFNDAFVRMRAAVNQSLDVEDPLHANSDLMHQVYKELTKRESQQAEILNTSFADKLRAVTHGWMLGLSPAYFLINLSQLGVLLWPELGARHGFVESAKAVARVTPIALKILRAQAAESHENGGLLRASDVIITMDSLKRAELTDEEARFAMNVISRAKVTLGSDARELGQLAEPSGNKALDNTLKVGASFGLYSETFNRLVSAFAARELYKDGKVKNQSVEDYASYIIDETMLNYSKANTARMLGKRGFLGPATPLITQFMQYNVQALEKLYREFHKAISKTASPEEMAQARRFLAGHAVAVMALAGTMGLPFANVVASVIDRIVDLFDGDDEPFDVLAASRNWMADNFGPGVAEVISRGGPRALGFDMSQRAGEQDMIPFSRFLTDRRNWKDKLDNQLGQSLGPSGSVLSNVVEGAGRVLDGDMGGLAQALPTFLRNPVQIYQMTQKGYQDSHGNVLPMTPRASAYLSQAIGFTPAQKAEYSEARNEQLTRKGLIVRRASVLRNQIADAILSGDTESARRYIAEAQNFDSKNPGFEVLPDIDNAIRRRVRSQALAKATNTPAGISPKDIVGQSMTRYANVN